MTRRYRGRGIVSQDRTRLRRLMVAVRVVVVVVPRRVVVMVLAVVVVMVVVSRDGGGIRGSDRADRTDGGHQFGVYVCARAAFDEGESMLDDTSGEHSGQDLLDGFKAAWKCDDESASDRAGDRAR